MTEVNTTIPNLESNNISVPAIEDVYDIMHWFGYYESGLWRPHHDSTYRSADSEFIFTGYSANDATNLQEGLDTLQAAEGHFDRTKFSWLPKTEHVINHAVSTAERIRRQLSSDSFAMSDSLPHEKVVDNEDPQRRKRFLHRIRAGLVTKLRDKHESVADSILHQAERSGDYHELTPLESEREYHDITPDDIDQLAQEEPNNFIILSADILSPIRNEHKPLSDETLSHLVDLINGRSEEIGPFKTTLLLNCWRLAQQNSSAEVATTIQSLLDEQSALRHFMDAYEPREPTGPSRETMKQNVANIMDEFVDSGGDPHELIESESDKPKVRMRLAPETLQRIAMRDGGYIRSGDEGGALVKSGRGDEGNYAYIRRLVEKELYGDAAIDEVITEPIVYGYYADEEAEQTIAMQSMVRVYGAIELVFKDDITADKRVIYGDSMNAIAAEAGGNPVTPELVEKILGQRVITEEDATTMSQVISKLHGSEENTEFNPSANPYVECLLRGRLGLGDCEEIRVPAKIYDGNPSLMSAIQEKYGVAVTRIE